MSCYQAKIYEIIPTETFQIIRNCSGCGSKSVYQNTQKIRVNANGKQVDVWLIYQCSKCKHTYNLPVYSRVNRNAIDPEEYEALQKSQPEIVIRLGLDRNLFQKNGAKIYEEPPYVLRDLGRCGTPNTVIIRNPFQLRLRHDRLAAECLGISRTKAQKLLESGEVKAESLSETELIFKY